MDYGYIYKTTNLINGKIYIGQHKATKFNDRYLGSGKRLKEAIIKYGKNNFEVLILDESAKNEEELNKLEIFYIEKYDARNPQIGYNLHCGGNVQSGENNPMHGKRFKKSEEAIEKTRKSHLGVQHSPESRKKMSYTRNSKLQSEDIIVWNKGKILGPRTIEARLKTSETLRNKWKNDKEFKDKMHKMYLSRIGIKRSEEFKENQRKNALGNTNVMGKKWYNNGVKNIRCFEGQQPENFYLGKLGKHFNQYTKKD